MKKLTKAEVSKLIAAILNDHIEVLDKHQCSINDRVDLEERIAITMESLTLYAIYCINILGDTKHQKLGLMYHFFEKIDCCLNQLMEVVEKDEKPTKKEEKKNVAKKRPTNKKGN